MSHALSFLRAALVVASVVLAFSSTTAHAQNIPSGGCCCCACCGVGGSGDPVSACLTPLAQSCFDATCGRVIDGVCGALFAPCRLVGVAVPRLASRPSEPERAGPTVVEVAATAPAPMAY